MPKSDKHLIEYSKHANYDSLNEITSRLETSTITLSMPKFRFECTSRAEKHLAKVRNISKNIRALLYYNEIFRLV